MNVVREIQRLNEKELARGTTSGSWHDQYKDSAWVYVGNMPFELTEGDVICVMSQWGEIEDLHLVRDKDTGKSKGFAFVKYENQKSTILAVDNFNGVTLLGRVLRVDHKEKYALPKEILKKEEEMEKEALEKGMPVPESGGAKWKPGHAYEGKELASEHDIKKGVDLFQKPKDSDSEEEDDEDEEEEEDDEIAGRGVEDEALSKEEKKKRKKEEKKRRKEEKKARKKEKKKRKREEGEHEREEPIKRREVEGADGERWEQQMDGPEALPVAPAGESWRGRMDPTARSAAGDETGRRGPPPPRGGRGFMPRGGGGSMFGRAFVPGRGRGRADMSGIAGMNRRR